jgi:hypothetical protein
MSRWLPYPVLSAALPMLAWMGMGTALPPTTARPSAALADTSSVLDGVFTRNQAMRGKDVFDVTCMRCHTLEDFVTGPHAPTKKWSSVGGMFSTVSVRMPYDDPGSLSYTEYAAVVSYLLQQNGYPARDSELSTDPRKLRLIRIVPLPDSSSEPKKDPG